MNTRTYHTFIEDKDGHVDVTVHYTVTHNPAYVRHGSLIVPYFNCTVEIQYVVYYLPEKIKVVGNPAAIQFFTKYEQWANEIHDQLFAQWLLDNDFHCGPANTLIAV